MHGRLLEFMASVLLMYTSVGVYLCSFLFFWNDACEVVSGSRYLYVLV